MMLDVLFKINLFISSERGNALVLSFAFIGFVAIISFFILHLLETETKMVHYYIKSEQAFQIASSGIEVAVEEAYLYLEEFYSLNKELPTIISVSPFNFFNNKAQNSSLIISELNKIEQNEDYSTYTFTSQGFIDGAKQNIKIEVRFYYTNYYIFNYEEDGILINKTFNYRVFHDRGKITSFNIVN